MGASPGAAVALTRMNAEIDIRDVLPSIRVPTLVLHRTGDCCLKIEEGRYLASRINGATLVELDGADHLPFLGEQDAMFGAIEGFLAGTRAETPRDLALATVVTMVTPAGSARVEFVRIFDQLVALACGRVMSPTPGHAVAAFDGPGRAVRCAASVVDTAARAGIEVRAGLHVGECDLARGTGAIFDLSAAIADMTAGGEVVVSRTIVDLVPGSGLEFLERPPLTGHGRRQELPLFAVKT
jgi:hypothetical protein